MGKPTFKSVDDYIESQPEAAQDMLQQVRTAIRKAVPEADESISYNMPTYKLRGKLVIYFAGWKHHYSLYPAGKALLEAFQGELMPYEVTKGTIKFPLAKAVPVNLISRIVRFRASELDGYTGRRVSLKDAG